MQAAGERQCRSLEWGCGVGWEQEPRERGQVSTRVSPGCGSAGERGRGLTNPSVWEPLWVPGAGRRWAGGVHRVSRPSCMRRAPLL